MGCHKFLVLAISILVLSEFISDAQSARRRTTKLSLGLKRDRLALMALQRSMSSFGRSSMATWKSRGNPCVPKPWHHISCRRQRVSHIELSNLELMGTLPSQIMRMNRLVELNLEDNSMMGTLPTSWAGRTKLRQLKYLKLGNNFLEGSLPNHKWNARGAFRLLRHIDLSYNSFTGGLPDGWMSSESILDRVQYLDLAGNKLGLGADSTPLDPYAPSVSPPTRGWCLEGRTPDSGWCPDVVNKGRAGALEVLDLSENDLEGQLPDSWPKLFPNLQFLLLHLNSLWAGAEAKPGVLPLAWTRFTAPRAFPQLDSLVLYPGNPLICSLPDPNTLGYQSVNTEWSYLVLSDIGLQYDAQSPSFCEGALENNPPTQVGVASVSDTLHLTWDAPAGADTVVFGYLVSLFKEEDGSDEWYPLDGWLSRLIQTYGIDPAAGGFSLSGDTYTVDTEIAQTTTDAGAYRLQISSFNMDGVESSLVVVEVQYPA